MALLLEEGKMVKRESDKNRCVKVCSLADKCLLSQLGLLSSLGTISRWYSPMGIYVRMQVIVIDLCHLGIRMCYICHIK